MVREKTIVPPVYLAVAGAAVSLYGYAFGLLSIRGCVILAFLSLASLCAASCFRQFVFTNSANTSHTAHCAYTSHSRRIAGFVIACSIGILCGALSAARLAIENETPITLAPLLKVKAVTGTLIQDPSPYGPRYYRARMKLDSAEDSKGLVATVQGDCVVAIPVSLVRESLPGFFRVSHGGSVNYAAGHKVKLTGGFVPELRDSIDPTLFIVDPSSAIPARDLGWRNGFDRLRASLRLSLSRTLYDWGPSGGFLFALVSGNRDYLDPVLAQDFTRCGLAHVLALSGTHLSLLALVVVKTGKRFTGKRIALVLSLVAMFFFVWFAGASPSLDRALIFACLAFGTTAIGLPSRLLPLLAAASLAQMAINPGETVSLAFILSVTALWGIGTFGERFLELIERHFPRKYGSDLAASVGAQLMTAPVIAIAIGTLAPMGIVASCLIAPLSSIFLLAGSGLLAFSAIIPPISPVAGHILDSLYSLIAQPAHFIARFPVIEVRVLPAVIAASIIPLTTGATLAFLSAAIRKRRSCDDGFARL
jgi:ComEC/Rec2-related protein